MDEGETDEEAIADVRQRRLSMLALYPCGDIEISPLVVVDALGGIQDSDADADAT